MSRGFLVVRALQSGGVIGAIGKHRAFVAAGFDFALAWLSCLPSEAVIGIKDGGGFRHDGLAPSTVCRPPD
jgi:hypothetical protein